MIIKKVELLKPSKQQSEMGAVLSFSVTTDEDVMATIVPADPANRHYHEIREWYDKKKLKPFRYDFDKNKPK